MQDSLAKTKKSFTHPCVVVDFNSETQKCLTNISLYSSFKPYNQIHFYLYYTNVQRFIKTMILNCLDKPLKGIPKNENSESLRALFIFIVTPPSSAHTCTC